MYGGALLDEGVVVEVEERLETLALWESGVGEESEQKKLTSKRMRGLFDYIQLSRTTRTRA